MPHSTPPAPLFADLRSLPRAFWVLFAGTFINRFGTFIWPFLTIYLTRQGHSLTAAAWAVSAFGIGSFFGSAIGGWLSDHLGRRHTIVIGTFSAATFFMLLYSANSLPMIILWTALAGMAGGVYHPAISALLADIVPEGQQVRASAALRLAANAGFAFGVSLGGILANTSLFWLFAGDALTTAIYGCIALAWLPHGLRRLTQKTPMRLAWNQLRVDRTFHALWIAAFFATLIFSQFGSTYSLQVIRLGLTADFGPWHLPPETVYGLLLGWNGALIVLVELPLTTATLRFNPRRVIAFGHALAGLGFALNAFAHTIFTLWIAMTIFTFGEMISSPTSSAYLARIAPEQMRGRYMGTLSLAWSGAGILGPQLGFHLFSVNPTLVWFTCGFLGLVAAAVMLRVPPNAKDSSHRTSSPDVSTF